MCIKQNDMKGLTDSTESRKRMIWIIVVLWFSAPLFADYPVTRFGAVGDGMMLNTEAIQQAIDACAADGGGRVVIPPGRYLSGTLVLRDHVELHLSAGAVLLGSTDIGDYPEIVTPYRFYGDEWVRQSLIFGYGLTHIAITGKGVIDGQGGAFRVDTKKRPDRYMNRPYLVRFTECSYVTLKDVMMRNSAMWMQHYLACDHVRITGITVFNHCNQNNDMIDIDGCSNVIISDCRGDTDDDALTLKSTSLRPCENITITNCILSSHCNAIKFGTESTGGFRNITISNCIIKPSADRQVIYGFPDGISGISLETVDGGILEGVVISDVLIDGPEVPLFIRLGYRARPYMEGAEPPLPGPLQDVTLRNILVQNGGKIGCSITGIPGHPVRNIRISGLTMELEGGVNDARDMETVPEMIDSYPESTMFGVLPSSLFFIRHAEGISLQNIRARFSQPDRRPHLVLDNAEDMDYDDIMIHGAEPLRVVER